MVPSHRPSPKEDTGIRKIRRHGLRFRLLALIVSLTTVPVLLLTVVAVNNTRTSVEAQILDATLTRVRWATQYLEEVLQRFDDLFYSLQIDEGFRAVLEAAEAPEVAEAEGGPPGAAGGDAVPAASEAIQRELIRLMTTSYYSYVGMVDQLTVYIHAMGRAWELDNVAIGRVTVPDLAGDLWRGVLDEPISLELRGQGPELYALHTINRFADQGFRGAMIARIEDEFPKTVLGILESSGGGAGYLVDADARVLLASSQAGSAGASAPEAATLGEIAPRVADRGAPATLAPLTLRTGTDLVVYQAARRGGLSIIKTVPLEMVTASAAETIAVGLGTSAVLVAASLILSVVFSLRITRPIVQLAESMRQASVPAFVDRRGVDRDEIRQLQQGYEALIARIKALVEREFRQEMELKDARLLSLQAQINPHFLNNTLNLLGGMAVANGVPKIYELARAIGDMFRYAASAERDLVPLSDEIAHVRNYLLIQEQRFAGRCTTELDVDREVESTPIPRFTLQPLLENAFEHGLQGKRGRWRVSLRACRRRSGTMVVVEDDGAGMSAAALAALRAGLKSGERGVESSARIGLRNVNARLAIHFGEGYGLRIFSTAGRGTRVIVVVPSAAGVNGG